MLGYKTEFETNYAQCAAKSKYHHDGFWWNLLINYQRHSANTISSGSFSVRKGLNFVQ